MKNKYNWLTCPFCDEVSELFCQLDTGDLGGMLIAWKCNICSRLFFIRQEDINYKDNENY